MPTSQVQVMPVTRISYSDGMTPTMMGGKSAEAIVADLHGRYYTLASSGRVFHVTTAAAGLALPISTSTTGFFSLWNPAGSGVNVVPIRYEVAYVSGTGVLGSFGFMAVTPAGAQAGTASPVPTATFITTARNGFLGSGGAANNPMALVTSAFTLTTVGVHYRGMGISQQVVVPAGTSFVPNMFLDFQGTTVMAPGSMIYPAATAATVSLFYQTFIWAEVPQ